VSGRKRAPRLTAESGRGILREGVFASFKRQGEAGEAGRGSGRLAQPGGARHPDYFLPPSASAGLVCHPGADRTRPPLAASAPAASTRKSLVAGALAGEGAGRQLRHAALTQPSPEPAHAFFPAPGSRRRLTSLSQPRDSGSASTGHLMAGGIPPPSRQQPVPVSRYRKTRSRG
jgi:hypothetical protein